MPRGELVVVYEFQEVVDDLGKALGLGADFGEGSGDAGGVSPAVAATACAGVGRRRRRLQLPLRKLGGAEDVGDGGPQFMAGEFHEAAFGLVGAGELADVFLELAGHLVEIAGPVAEFILAEGKVRFVAKGRGR